MIELHRKQREDEKRWMDMRADDEVIRLDRDSMCAATRDPFRKAYETQSFFISHSHRKGYVRVSPELETWAIVPVITKDAFSQAVKIAFEQLQEPVCRNYLLAGANKAEAGFDWQTIQFVGQELLPTQQLDQTRQVLQFEAHAKKWYEETMYLSSAIEIVLHPSYQRIIGMGPAVLPLIFRDLEQNGRDWFWALSSITGENPLEDEDAGNVPKMKAAWLNWGRQHGYI